MGNYYVFISKKGKNSYDLTIEYGKLNDSPYDYSEILDKKIGLSKDEVNNYIESDTLNSYFIYEGLEINKLF